jgi:electron transfer flavoprotein alpha subunit
MGTNGNATKKVLVLAEHDDATGELKDISFELLGLAHRVAATNGWSATEIKALLLGNEVDELASKLAARGAGEVLYLEGEAVAHYTGDGYRKAIEPVLEAEAPALVLIGHTPNGWDIAPLLAGRLGVPVATGCASVTIEDNGARFVRKAFNGKFVHEVSVDDAWPLIATIDKGASPEFEGATEGTVRKIEVSLSSADLRTRYVETKEGETSGLDLTQASIIVSAGRGVGDTEKLSVIRELAEALGGQLGASRAVTDAGWLPHEHQIGSSGVSVSPKLYVACGISGAIQHVVGMKSSEYIVAINKDADAPIFGVADVGVAGDLFEIVPALTKAVKEAKG